MESPEISFFKANRPEWADRHRWNNNTALCPVRDSVMLLIRFPLMPSCSSERKTLRVTLRNLRKLTGRVVLVLVGGMREKRAEKLEWVKLTQLKWIHNIVNNTRPTVSRGCCSFIFKCFRYAVVLQPSSPTVFGRVQPDSWLPAFGESHISETIPPLPVTFSCCKEVPDLTGLFECSVLCGFYPRSSNIFTLLTGDRYAPLNFS